MARLEPFAGIRFAPEAGPLSDLVAPPYDVVDAAGRAELVSLSPANAILVELPAPDEHAGLDPYENAARIFASWLEEGIVRRDGSPSFYVHRMTFADPAGQRRSTTGVIGALAVGADVLPHEQTMPKPKGDRLYLLRATRVNLSPIWGLSLSQGLAGACERAAARSGVAPAAAEVEGVRHELWPVVDQESLAEIAGLVAATPVLIADGHHRYETAAAYREERRAANGGAPGDYDLVMALVVELADDELFVRPINRLVAGIPAGFDLPGALAPYFDCVKVPEGAIPGRYATIDEAMADPGALGLTCDQGTYLLVPTPATLAAAEADLDSSRLDVALAALPPHELTYQHGTAEIFEAVRSGAADAGFFLRPATVAQIAETAHGGRRMPPKTTFFYPKPRTGMVFRPLVD